MVLERSLARGLAAGQGGADAIAAWLDLPRELVPGVLAFLMDVGLLERDTGGYRLVAKRTHLGPSSPFAALHHETWRCEPSAVTSR